MSNQESYSAEDWEEVVNGPAVAGSLIVMADPAFFGAIKESAAIAKAINEFAVSSDTELIRAIGQFVRAGYKFKTPDMPKDQGMEAVLIALIAECRRAAKIVNRISPDESNAYREYLVAIAQQTAESSKEGGFLGIGAVRVSEQEEEALKKLREALAVEFSEENGDE
jgi:hypothetical protein